MIYSYIHTCVFILRGLSLGTGWLQIEWLGLVHSGRFGKLRRENDGPSLEMLV